MICLNKSRSMLPTCRVDSMLEIGRHSGICADCRNIQNVAKICAQPHLSICLARTSSHLSQKLRALSGSHRMLLLCYIFAILQLNTMPPISHPCVCDACLIFSSYPPPRRLSMHQKHNQNHPQPRRKDKGSSKTLDICKSAKTNMSY